MTDLDLLNLPDHAANADQSPSLADLIDAAIDHADRQRAELAEQGDLEGLAYGLHAIREVQRKLAMLISQTDGDVSRLVLERPKGETVVIDGLGSLETKRRSTRTKWESERLFGLLVDRICDEGFVDPHTGEMVGDPATAKRIADGLRERLAAAVPLTASMGWRVGGLKAAGIDPNDFREQEHGPYTTRILGAEQT